jgi:hypothetical protein
MTSEGDSISNCEKQQQRKKILQQILRFTKLPGVANCLCGKKIVYQMTKMMTNLGENLIKIGKLHLWRYFQKRIGAWVVLLLFYSFLCFLNLYF